MALFAGDDLLKAPGPAAANTVMDRARSEVRPEVSATRTVKFDDTAPEVAVPEITPVDGLSTRPAGSEPETTDQVADPDTPDALKVWE